MRHIARSSLFWLAAAFIGIFIAVLGMGISVAQILASSFCFLPADPPLLEDCPFLTPGSIVPLIVGAALFVAGMAGYLLTRGKNGAASN